MKYLSLLCALLAVAASSADNVDPNCDRILNSMADGCKNIRSSLISPKSMDPKVVCCGQLRYNICVQSVNGYATIAKATRICPAQNYDSTMVELNSNIAMAAVKALCEKFDSQTCITDPLNSAWTEVKNTVQQNVDIDKLGQQIGQNWQNAMSSLGTFAQGLQDSIAKQNIPGRLREGASAIQASISDRTKQISDAVSGQGINRYSVVGEGDKQQDSLSLDSIVHSVLPEVEIVEKQPDIPVASVDKSSPVPAGKRFSFMDWFNSLSFMNNNANSTPSSQPQANPVERSNPYNVV